MYRREFNSGSTLDTSILEIDISPNQQNVDHISIRIRDDEKDEGRVVYIHNINTLRDLLNILSIFEMQMALNSSDTSREGKEI